ncbi:bifunctional folylpolyglutamate synthase/dihydrofolate synthase [Fictibacillus iocasae]|uniref:tetrahydrofolate synthase n=1 Tax=Fictibacillus iocasae TaxID=2715437 RepID=A0ABW2NLF8_9BACL
MQNYEEMNNYLGLKKGGRISPGLASMNRILKKLGDPHRAVKTIHIAGTNGKGSTGAYLQGMLTEAGYTAGVFSSPFMHTVNEHIQVNGSAIGDEELIRVLDKLKSVMREEDLTITEFEAITAAAFFYFGTIAIPDFCIIEAGMGGTWDSTNVVEPVLSIITNVGSDHTDYLGNTLVEVAEHKAGIIKHRVPVVTGRMDPEPLMVIKEKAEEKLSPHLMFGKEYRIEKIHGGPYEESFLYHSLYSDSSSYTITMLGAHQVDNAAAALMAVDSLQNQSILSISEEERAAGLKRAAMPGRFERVREQPLVFIDGAHNPQGTAALSELLKKTFLSKKIHVIFSALADKQKEEMLKPLYRAAASFTFTEFDHPRSGNIMELYRKSDFPDKRYEHNWMKAIDEIIEAALEEEVIVITGSLYFIAEVRKYMKDFPHI